MVGFAGVRILNRDLYSDFHRRVEHPVHAGFQDEHVADADRVQKADVVHRCSYYRLSCVPPRRESATKIDQVHDVTAQDVAKNIRVIGQRNLRVFGTRFTDGTTFEWRLIQECFLMVMMLPVETHRPWNLGARFSRKADVPSPLSPVAEQIAKYELSRTNPSAWLVSKPLFTASMANLIDRGALPLISLRTASARGMSCSAGTTSFTRPMRYAS